MRPLISPQPLTTHPDVLRAERLQRILNGTATSEDIRSHLVNICEAGVEEAVNDAVELSRGWDERGMFWTLENQPIEVVLEDDELRGYCIRDRGDSFSGRVYDEDGNGHDWVASPKVAQVCRDRFRFRALTIKLEVEGL